MARNDSGPNVIGETDNVLEDNPDVVAQIMVHVENARTDLEMLPLAQQESVDVRKG